MQLKREARALKIIELENSPRAQVGAATVLKSELPSTENQIWQRRKGKREHVIKINF
jgi:hypothetical protein